MKDMKVQVDKSVSDNISVPKTAFKFMFFVFSKFKYLGFGSIIIVVFAAAFSQATSYFFKLIVDAASDEQFTQVFVFALLYPTSIFAVQLLYRLSGFFGGRWTTSSRKYANDILVRYILSHSHGYFINRFSGSLLSKVGNVVNALDQFIPDLLWTHLTAFVAFLLTAVFIMFADTLSGILFLTLVIVLILTNRLFAPRKKEISYQHSELATKLRGIIVDVFTNVSAARQFVRIEDEINRIEDASEDHRQAGKKSWSITEVMLLSNSVILLIFSIGIFYLLVQRWGSGDIGTGDFVFILALYSQITGTLLFIGRAFNNTARALGEMTEGLEEILLPYEVVDTPSAMSLVVQKGGIEWKAVTFTYEKNEVFKNLDLVISGGERMGLVGTSGAGKTTFVSLLLRQHDLQSGTITIDGQNIAQVTQDSLRENIAVVPQEPMLFHRSIRENIMYGKLDATDEELIAVAKKAQAHEFISTLPQGYDTLVGERGVKLSGGQKQRIAIARAMLKNAPILLLDEATSALDSESEVAIQRALHELMEGKTVIAIAHRLSTLREMDRIIVLENGKVIEDGTHASLIKKKGSTYARLWKHQAGGFIE